MNINGDGLVNVLDVVLVVQNALGNNVFDEQQFENADVNLEGADGAINVLDIVTIVQYILAN